MVLRVFCCSVLIAALGCSGEERSVAERYSKALTSAQRTPDRAIALCEGIRDDSIRFDCLGQIAGAISKSDPSRAPDVCRLAGAGVARFECFFRVAESLDDLTLCAEAGPFRRPCFDHFWARHLPTALWGQGWKDRRAQTRAMLTPIGSFEDRIGEEMVTFGMDVSLEGTWIAVYRAVFLQQCPLEAAQCLTAAPIDRVRACLQGAQAALNTKQPNAFYPGSRSCFSINGARDLKQLLGVQKGL